MMPKISVKPTPRKNKSAACDNAFRHCVSRNARNSIRLSVGIDHLVAGRRDLLGRIGGDYLWNWAIHTFLLHDLDDEARLGGLMIAGAHLDRTLDAVNLQAFERRADFRGFPAAGLLNAGLQHDAGLVL